MLSTPTGIPEIIRGQQLAQRRLFTGPFLILTLYNLLVLAHLGWRWDQDAGELWRVILALTGLILGSAANLVAAGWLGMWFGLCASKAGEGGGNALMRMTMLPTTVMLGVVVVAVLRLGLGHPFPDLETWIVLATATVLVSDVILVRWARRRLRNEFRQVVAERGVVVGPAPSWTAVLGRAVSRLWRRPGLEVGDRDRLATLALRDRLRAWRWSLAVIAVLLLICSLYRLHLRQRVGAGLAVLQAAGAPIRTGDLKRIYPRVPRESYAANLIGNASASLIPGRSVSTNFASGQYQSFQTNAVLNGQLLLDARTLVLTNQTALGLLVAAAAGGPSHYDLDWEEALRGVSAPHTQIAELNQLLQVAFRVSWQDRSTIGVESALLGRIALVNSLAHVPSRSLQSRRFRVLKALISDVEWALNQRPPTGDQIDYLASLLGLVEHLAGQPLTPAIQGERCFAFDRITCSAGEKFRRLSGAGPTSPAEYLVPLVFATFRLAGTDDHAVLYLLKFNAEVENAARLPSHARGGRLIRIEAEVEEGRSLFNFEAASTLRGDIDLLWDQSDVLAGVRQARIAVAVERHHLIHEGEWPASLSFLETELPGDALLDPSDGWRMRYVTTGIGYRLFSVGRNARDDGGTRHPKLWKDDIVFEVQRE
jgi:hypothetical protein